MTRRRSRLLAAAAAVLAAGAVGAVPALPAAAATSGAYYVSVPVCPQDVHTHASCLAMKRERVSASTPGARRAAVATRHSDVTFGPAGGYTPADLASAYGFDPDAATDQTVAVIEAHDTPTLRADLDTFDAHYGLPAETATSLQIVDQNGGTDYPVADADSPDPSWSVEASLDVDAVRGVCHHCNILVVEANSDGTDESSGLVDFSDFGAAEATAYRLGADEISNSWGLGEQYVDFNSINSADFALGQAAAARKVVVLASTGDYGMYDWDYANQVTKDTTDPDDYTSSESPLFPSSLPSTVAVGGTSLYFNDDGTRSGEKVWNNDGPANAYGSTLGASLGATGGGCSVTFPASRWQQAVAGWARTACGTSRLAADVSALGDPITGYDIYDSYQVKDVNTCDASTADGCWSTFGGTSLAAPIIAAMWALAGGPHGLADPALALYGHLKSAPSALNDITIGGSGFCDGLSTGTCQSFLASGETPNTLQFSGTTTNIGTTDCGWQSFPSGHGDELSAGTRACNASTGYDGASGVGTPNGLSAFTVIPPTAAVGKPGSPLHGRSAGYWGGGSSDPYPGGAISTYYWSFGDGTTAVGTTGVQPHTYARAGRYAIKLRVVDSYGLSSGYATQTVTVR